jgi:hypothetical protein
MERRRITCRFSCRSGLSRRVPQHASRQPIPQLSADVRRRKKRLRSCNARPSDRSSQPAAVPGVSQSMARRIHGSDGGSTLHTMRLPGSPRRTASHSRRDYHRSGKPLGQGTDAWCGYAHRRNPESNPRKRSREARYRPFCGSFGRPESPRVSRRPHFLRGWGHGTTKQVFTRGTGAGCPDGA